jgi:hypothetical protein
VKYFRISPATRFWMLQLNYTENDLPKDKMIVNKYVLKDAIKRGIKIPLKEETIEKTKSNFIIILFYKIGTRNLNYYIF